MSLTTCVDLEAGTELNVTDSNRAVIAQSLINASIPYVDVHYGSADGIIDPTEYAYSYTDPATGIVVYLEHNSTIMYVGLSASTSGWIAIGWQDVNGTFATAGLNNSDLIFGYAPGNPYQSFSRVTGSESVTVHYKLYLRDGSLLQEGNAPTDSSTTALQSESLLTAYKNAIIGMRIGEVRHFIIPAKDGYTKPTDALYGEDLEYVVTLTRIGSNKVNPTVSSAIVYRDDHGTSTFAHSADMNQSQIVAANATGTTTRTQVEYLIRMNSTDLNDIPILNGTDIHYPMIVMLGNNENIDSLPVQHTDWSHPIVATFEPNSIPSIEVTSPQANATLSILLNLKANITDNTFVRRAGYRIDDKEWGNLTYDFADDLWKNRIDLSDYDVGIHTVWLNATDPSNKTVLISFNITVDVSSIPLLGMRLSLGRTVSTLLYHELKIADAFTITNNGSAPIGAIEFYLPREFTSKFLAVYAEDSAKNSLEVVRLEDVNGLQHWRVSFFSPVGFAEGYTLTVTTHLHSTQEVTDFAASLYRLEVTRYPLVPYLITRASLSFAFRSGDTLKSASPESVTYNIAPMTYEHLVLSVQSYTPLVVASRVTEITIDTWGWLAYKETISLENIGPAKESTISVTFPAYAASIRVYDRVGVLVASTPDEHDWNETLTQTINLKTDRFGDNGFYPGYKYTFNIQYVIQLTSYQTADVLGNRIDLPMLTLGEILVQTHTVDVQLPATLSIVEASGDYRLLYGVTEAILQYTAYNTSRLNPISISITYQMSIGAVARPVLFSLLIGVVALVYVSYRKSPLPRTEEAAKPGEEATVGKQVGAPTELLSSFASTYSKKTALELDLEKLQSFVKRGKVTRKEFMIRERDIKGQLEQLSAKLVSLREELVSYGSKYRDTVAQLELQDERIAGAKAGLAQLFQRRKTQKISRAAFEKSRMDYLKTMKQAVAATDRILMALQEEAGDV